MLIKHKINSEIPASKTYLFIELHLEDWRSKYKHKTIAHRVLKLAKDLKGTRRGNVVRILRSNLTEEVNLKLDYLDKVSSRYKLCLLRNNFNYGFRQYNNFQSQRSRRFTRI